MQNNEMITEPETFSALVAKKIPEELDVSQLSSSERTRCGGGMARTVDD